MENKIRQFRQKNKTSSDEQRRAKAVSYFDYTFLLVLIFLVGFGLIMVYSASYYEAMQTTGNPAYYLKKQLIAVLIGWVGVYVAYKIPYKFYDNLGWFPYVICYVVFAMIIPFGHTVNGATRWIKLGFITFQAAEPVKLGMIIFLASFVNAYRKSMNNIKTIARMAILVAPVCAAVLFITNNLSSAIIIGVICVVMLFVATKSYKYYIAIILVGIAAVTGFVLYLKSIINSNVPIENTGGFRFERFLAWLDLEKYADGKGYQTLQSLYAIGSGGIWGKGLCQSIQKLNFLPEAQNDMIFSIICEELGLFGGIAVILMFALLIWRMVIIATHAPNLHGAMLVVGVIAHISVQVILNIAVVTNTIPNTGISLPFISYGGTSVCFLMFEMGIVMNVAKHIKIANYK